MDIAVLVLADDSTPNKCSHTQKQKIPINQEKNSFVVCKSMAIFMNGVSQQKSKTFFLHFLIDYIILHNLSKI
jgi:hypothetical protein